MAAASAAGSPEALAASGSDRLLKAAGTLVSDNTVDARNAARELISLVQVRHLDLDLDRLPEVCCC